MSVHVENERAPLRRLTVLDTTLRDAEQAPGLSLSPAEKLRVASALAALGVDIIEAGFPYSSAGEFEALRAISAEVQGPVICSLARARQEDILCAHRAMAEASRRRINIFHPVSDILLRHQMGMGRDAALRRCTEMVQYAGEFFDDIEFCPMDATRTDRAYLAEVTEAVIAAGATTVNIADTVGYSTAEEFGALIRFLKERVSNMADAALSVHCHNDLGMALANTLSGVLNGAEQVECTIDGRGERAGNCSLAALVAVLRARADIYAVRTAVRQEYVADLLALMKELWAEDAPVLTLKNQARERAALSAETLASFR